MSDPAYVALALVPGVGRVRFETLLRAFGSADAVLSASFKQLRALRGISPAVATAISETTPESGTKVLARVAAQDGVALTPFDPEFPSVLTQIPDAPVLLFARGRLELLHTSCVAVVGSRDPSRYGAEVAATSPRGVHAPVSRWSVAWREAWTRLHTMPHWMRAVEPSGCSVMGSVSCTPPPIARCTIASWSMGAYSRNFRRVSGPLPEVSHAETDSLAGCPEPP